MMRFDGLHLTLILGTAFLQARCVGALALTATTARSISSSQSTSASTLWLSTGTPPSNRSDRPWLSTGAPPSKRSDRPRIKEECPPQLNGILYNHISKTGGTAFKELLQAVFTKDGMNTKEELGPSFTTEHHGRDGAVELGHNDDIDEKQWKLVIQDDVADMQVSEEDRNHFFVMGLVRRPCDYFLSRALSSGYGQKGHSAGYGLGEYFDIDNGRLSPLMSKAMEQRYGSNEPHCVVTANNLKDDFIACVRKFQACGGVVTSTPSDANIEIALRKADGPTSARRGASASNTATCKEMIDDELMTKLLETEQAVIDKFNLGSCCS